MLPDPGGQFNHMSAHEEVKHGLQAMVTKEGMGMVKCSPRSMKIVVIWPNTQNFSTSKIKRYTVSVGTLNHAQSFNIVVTVSVCSLGKLWFSALIDHGCMKACHFPFSRNSPVFHLSYMVSIAIT